jgi:NAD(P)-dependent dehydrogenase (short-subunit alcohol dehydrogenase family)
VGGPIEEARAALGPLTILINNAAISGPMARIAAVDPAQWAYALAVNLNGPFYAAQALLPDMLAAGWGRIINISSGAAVGANPGLGAYSVSKAGLDHFTRMLDAENHAAGVAAMTVYPGIMATEMQAQARALAIPETDTFREYHARNWLRPPAESATLVRYLCGPDGADYHGQGVNIQSSAVRAKLGLPDLPEALQRP